MENNTYTYAEVQPTYAAKGWNDLVPVTAGNIVPPGTTGAKRRPVTSSEVNQWGKRTGMFGLVLPQNVIALDVDTKDGKDGLGDLATLEAALGELPSTWRSSAREDGSGHLYYRLPYSVALRSNDAEKALHAIYGTGEQTIEVLHSAYRFAYVWPSPHRYTGDTYSWFSPSGEPVEDVPEVSSLPLLPNAWFDVIDCDSRDYSQQELTPLENLEFVQDKFLETKAHADALVDGADGSWDEAAKDFAWYTAHMVMHGQAGAEDTYTGHALVLDLDGDDERGTRGTSKLERAIEALTPAYEEKAAEEADRNAPLDWLDIWGADIATDYLTGELMERGEQVSLYGPGGEGKSTFARAWALSMANGLPFLGKEAKAPVKVLFLDAENGLKIIQREFRKLGIRPSSNLIYLSFPEVGSLDTDAGGEKFLKLLDAHKPDVVFFDSASRFISGEEDSSGPWIQWHRLVLNPMKARGIASVRLDHPGKDLSRGQRGSSAKTQDVDTIWRFAKSGDLRQLKCERSRPGNFEIDQSLFVKFDTDTDGKFWYQTVSMPGGGNVISITANDFDPWAALAGVGAQWGMTSRTLFDLSRDHNLGISKRRCEEIVKEQKEVAA